MTILVEARAIELTFASQVENDLMGMKSYERK